MRHLKIFTVLCLLFIRTGYATTPDVVECYQVDPLDKVLKEQMYFEDNRDTIAVAKGETASFQFVVRSIYPIQDLKIEATGLTGGSMTVPVGMKAFVGYVYQGRNTPRPSKDRLVAASGFYPDPLLEKETMDIPAMSNQPVWINYPVSRSVKEGLYSAEVTLSGKVNGKPFKINRQVNAKVYPVVLPEQTLWVTNWFNLSDRNLQMMNDGQPVTRFSERYWELAKVHANKMRDHGQNVYLLSPVSLCKYSISGTTFGFDFSNFDKTVELFINEGNLKRIEGGHLGSRLSNWTSPFGVSVPSLKGDETVFNLKPLENDTARAFLSQFIPALLQHLKDKKWDKIYWQHIADEPIIENASSYIAIANEVKKMAPEMDIIEANHSREVQNTIKVWVPQLDYFSSDYQFYMDRQNEGDEIWFYTCLNPQGNFANRFLEQPLIQTRILHWINYRFGATGYLHWGLNWWRDNPYGETTSQQIESGTTLPGGDAWIVYPAYGQLYGSIRLEAMRDGIADYELLKLLEKTKPKEAKEMARTLVYQFDLYDNNVASFRKKRVKLLDLLSEISAVQIATQGLLGDAWDAKSAGDNVLEKLVQVTAPPIKGTHDARLLIVGGKAYIVYYANDYKPGEGHGWGNILYLEMSVLDLATMKVERRIPVVKGEQPFDNHTMEPGAIYTAPVLQKDEQTIRVFFSSEDPGNRQSQVWYIDFDLPSQTFSKNIYKAKLKTHEGTFDMQPRYMYQDLLLGGFQPMEFVPDHAINAFDPRYHDGRIYVPLMIWPHVSGFSVLNEAMDTYELLGFINERGLTEMGTSFMPDKKWLAIVRADKEPKKYSFWESPDGREWTQRQGGYFEPKGTASKPTLDFFNGIYYLGWQAEENIENAFRSVYNIDISKDGVNWERKYRFETKNSFQYPFFYPYDGRLWFVVTQGNKDRHQERIMFGCLE